MVSALLVLMVMSGMVLAYLAVVADSKRTTRHRTEELFAEKAAESAIRVAIHEIWGRFETEREGLRTTPADFQAYLDGLGLTASAGASDVPVDWLERAALPLLGERPTLGSSRLDRLSVARRDTPEGIRLTFTATAVEGGAQSSASVQRQSLERHLSETWVVERTRFQGMEYAMLSNNLNCAFCHLNVDDAARIYNDDPSLFGSFPRVRVGTLDTFQSRHGTGGSRLAGTLYLGDKAVYSDGLPIDDWASLDLKSRRFDAYGMLEESGAGDLLDQDLDPADPVTPDPLENLYLEYGADDTPLVDGFLPEQFPAVFPDDGGFDPVTGAALLEGSGNRIVDEAEFVSSTESATGSLSGGAIEVVAPGASVDTAGGVDELADDMGLASLGATTEGSVVLIGTETDPILLNGEIAIDGDVVLVGFVKGTGVIKARGNIYLPSDVTYLDDGVGDPDRTFGISADGTQNAMALAAGGNILVGDIFHPRWGNGEVTSGTDSSFSFVWDEIAAFNKLEWMKAQPMLPGSEDDNRDPSSYSQPNPYYAGPDFVPRYYTFGPDSPVPILAGTGFFDSDLGIWRGPELAGSWGSWSLIVADPNDPGDPYLYGADGTPKAALSTLLGSDGWITEEMLQELLSGFLGERDEDEPLEIDAALYTGNSIFGLVSPRVEGTRAGELLINGAVVAGDIGLLAPRSLDICYDPRSASLLDIVYDSQLSIRHVLSSRAAN